MVCCLSGGISGATGIMVGNELGAGNLEQGEKYGIRLMKISCVCGIAVALLMCLAAPVILHFVKLTPEAPVISKGCLA
ncbi:MAG: MATE family efflux transporter [Gallintestinimicrobium sp.]